MATSVNFRFEGGKCYADITRDTVESVDVQIYGYTKRISGTENTIDITQYLFEKLKLEPTYQNGALAAEASVVPQISVGNDISRFFRTFPFGIVDMNPRVLSDLPYRRISPNQVDQISVGQFGQGSQLSIYSPVNMTTPSDTASNNRDIADYIGCRVRAYFDTTRMIAIVRNSNNDSLLFQSVEYKVLPMTLDGIRLCWINKYGVPEYWNFQFTRDITTAASFDSIYTKNGYEKINVKADKHYAIETRELDKATLDALSYILVSPAVWIANDPAELGEFPTYKPIHIISDQCRIYSDTELSTLQLEFCPKIRI